MEQTDTGTRGIGWLSACASLAAGELAAARFSCAAEAWPLAATLAALVAFFGYGFRMRFWVHLFIFVAGVALFLNSSVERERLLRGKPWMRGRMAQRAIAGQHDGSAPWIEAARNALSNSVGKGLAGNSISTSLNRAILLGERRKLPRDVRSAFVRSGAMHVFAVSGVHVMAVAHLLSMLLRILLFVPRRFAGTAAIPVVWLYVNVIGAPPSAVRAATMASICFLAPLFWRRPNAIVAWSLTFISVACLRPAMITDTGCALSFTVMLALLLAAEVMRGCSAAVSIPAMTFVAWAAGVPIAGRVFCHFTPGGLVANFALIPMASIAVSCGALGMMAGFFSDGIAAHLNNMAALATSAMSAISEVTASLPFSDFTVPQWTITSCTAWYAALVAGLLLLRPATGRTWLNRNCPFSPWRASPPAPEVPDREHRT